MTRTIWPDYMDPLDEPIIARPKLKVGVKPCARCRKPMEYTSDAKQVCFDCIQLRKKKWLKKNKAKINKMERENAKKRREERKRWLEEDKNNGTGVQ